MRLIQVSLLMLLVSACGTKNDLSEAQPQSTEQTASTTTDLKPLYCGEISDASEFRFNSEELKETYIVDYELREACICVVYQYSGCEKAKAYLSWDGHWPSEFHPVINMKLQVRKPGMCDMLLTDSACFSIKKLSFGGDQVGVTINEAVNRLDIDFTQYQ